MSSVLQKLLIYCLLLVFAQSALAASPGNTCDVAKDSKGAFTRPEIPSPYIVARFMEQPRPDAGVDAVRRHFVYEAILGRIASLKLSSATSRTCNFRYDIFGSLDLYFSPIDFTKPGFDECSLSRCAMSLVDLLQSMTIEHSMFSQVTAEGVGSMRARENRTPDSLTIARRWATVEAYRHIYANGTNAHTYLSLDADDFGSADYDGFQEWFGRQQALLQRRVEAPLSRGDDPRPATNQSSHDRSTDCRKTEVKIQELDINHHGWGHQSILLVKHGFRDEIDGIDNVVLRAFCPPYAGSPQILNSEPWPEMTGRISCSREGVDQDNWLIIASKERPVAAPIEMRRYAQAVAKVLNEQECVHPRLELILVNFLPQN